MWIVSRRVHPLEYLITNEEIDVSEKIMKKYDKAINRRVKREPIAYITGKKEFWSEDFIVNRSTLVPRPETELLIYKVIDFFKDTFKKVDKVISENIVKEYGFRK